jgi:hypothetical protein
MPNSAAPLTSAPQTSKVAASNEVVDAWATTSSRPKGTYSPTETSDTMSRWVTPIPLGRPVEPDVYMT